MKKNLKRLITLTLASVSALGMFACGKKEEKVPDLEYYVPEKENVADTTAPEIFASYEYKIVLAGEETTLPSVEFSESGVTATYTLEGEEVVAGGKFTPEAVGVYEFVVNAKDAANNKATPKTVKIRATNDASELNKIYDFETVEGIESHLGTSDMGNSQVRIHYEKVVDDPETDEEEKTDDGIPALKDDQGNVIVDSFAVFKNYQQLIKVMLNNPLYTHWDEKFEQIYFYVYNAGVKTYRLRFNNFYYAETKKGEWTKIVVAPKEVKVVVHGDDITTPDVVETEYEYTKIVTDYEAISSNAEEGKNPSTSMEGTIDLEDCVGSFIRVDYDMPFEKLAFSAIYGVPVRKGE